MNDIKIINNWYLELINDLRKLEFTGIVLTKWNIGKRIDLDIEKFGKPEYGSKKIENLAKDLNGSADDLWACHRFFKKYKEREKLDGVQQFSWRYIWHKLLPEPKEPKEIISLPEGKFSTIYIDPPWPVGSIVMDKWESPIEEKYLTMNLEEITNLPIESLSADNCNLFLWTTHTFLPDALEIIKKWNFKYHCLITWDKGNGWTQFGFNRRTEFLIYAYKGKILINYYGESIPTLISEAKTYHSKKPDKIRDLIKSKTPEGRLEMFARENYEGWICWGNEIKNND